jgi:hypothetical protein
MLGKTLPDPLDSAVRDIVFPAEPPEEATRAIDFRGRTITLRRQADTIEFEVPYDEDPDDIEDTAEQQLRKAFGLDTDTKEAEGRRTVFGFKTLVPGDGTRPRSKDTILMKIDRPPLIVEIL